MRATLRETATRHANGLALLVLVLSVAGFAAYLALYRTAETSIGVPRSDLLYAACQVLPYGLVGAVLVAKRPDLPFGWLLSLAAMSLVAVVARHGIPAVWAIESGNGGQLAVWGLTFGTLAVRAGRPARA